MFRKHSDSAFVQYSRSFVGKILVSSRELEDEMKLIGRAFTPFGGFFFQTVLNWTDKTPYSGKK